ncbi:MAG: hypothetical protein HQ582_06540 [Planctomycetes bacterium]|nr:hypothetical protein [Planctomycetota bacterium]
MLALLLLSQAAARGGPDLNPYPNKTRSTSCKMSLVASRVLGRRHDRSRIEPTRSHDVPQKHCANKAQGVRGD